MTYCMPRCLNRDIRLLYLTRDVRYTGIRKIPRYTVSKINKLPTKHYLKSNANRGNHHTATGNLNSHGLRFYRGSNFPFSYWFLHGPYNSAAQRRCLWYIVFLLDLGSFTNFVICIYILKIQIIKLAHTFEIDCFMTCNNQFCFSLKESRKIRHV